MASANRRVLSGLERLSTVPLRVSVASRHARVVYVPNSPKAGFVYVLTNRGMPGMVKIGVTTAADPETRVQALYTSSVPFEFDIEFAGRVQDCKKVEKALHFAFDNCRVNPKREFFKIGPENVIAVLELLSDEDATDQVAAQVSSNEAGTKRRPPLRFDDLGLDEGTVMLFKYDPSIKSEVSDHPRKVRLIAAPDDYEDYGSEGLPVRLWPLSRDLSVYCGYSANVGGPTQFWTLENNGTSLVDLYNKAYPLEGGSS